MKGYGTQPVSRQRGFTLLEMMLALSAGALMLLSVSKTYPVLRQQSVMVTRHYHLEQAMWHVTRQLAKDLRRAGFCAGGECREGSLKLGAYPREAADSCVLVSYDLNRNGQIEDSLSLEAEWFGYRLRGGNLESQRGVTGCEGSGWERILDQQAIRITRFQVWREATKSSPVRLAIRLEGHWAKWPHIRYQLESAVQAVNLR